MPMKFFIEKVIINGVVASLDDKFQFDKDFEEGKVKIKNVLDWGSYIDIETY